ncbi:unnamed protein product [Rhizophagus irregularis]|nr:unnamed protein product [Rhizophagus irregularis]
MNDSSQNLPGWLSDDLRPFVYERGLEDKVIELSKDRPAHSEKFISREGGAEAVPLSQEMPLASVTVPVVTSSLISPMVMYSILALLLIAVI